MPAGMNLALRRKIVCAAAAVFLPVLGPRAPAAAQPASGPADRSLPWVTPAVQAPRVVQRVFDSAAVGAKVSYHAYVPAAHGRSPELRLPVLYWLHGTGGGVSGIRPLAQFFDQAIEAGRVPPLIVVFVNGLPARLWADSKDGTSPVETVFIREVIPDVDRSFRTLASREGRILEGFSMGGYGAARLGFKHPELFAGISILAGGPFDLDLQGPRAQRNPRLREQLLREVCGNDMEYYRAISPWVLAEQASPTLRAQRTLVRHAVGTADDTRELNRRFRERMVELGIAHAWTELAGIGHDPRAVLERLAQVDADFYRQALAPAAPGPRPTSTVTPTVTSPLTSNVTAPGAQASTSPSR
jgi:enterochelin esterase-like enzyme